MGLNFQINAAINKMANVNIAIFKQIVIYFILNVYIRYSVG